MSSCCARDAYGKVFGRRSARRDASRYRKKGLDATARRLVEFLEQRGLEGTSVLEVGGGVGAIQLELLRAGAARAVNVELSPEYEESAAELLRDASLAGRVERHVMDFAQEAAGVAPADAVVMHRVVCCYPDVDLLVGAATERARRYLLMTFPRDTFPIRLAIGAANLWFRLSRRAFRAYVRPAAAVLAAAREQGLEPVLEHRGFVWELAALERPA